MKEFTINSLKEYTFRVSKISPVTFLALQTQIDFSDLKATETLFNFILEHIEVNINDRWFKVKDGDTYMPMGIEEQLNCLNEIVMYFLNNVYKPVFTKSEE